MNRRLQLALGIAAVACTAISVVHLFAIHAEYFGNGPPYYGRTTNMDKGTSPVAAMVVTGALDLLSLSWLLYAFAHLRRPRRPIASN